MGYPAITHPGSQGTAGAYPYPSAGLFDCPPPARAVVQGEAQTPCAGLQCALSIDDGLDCWRDDAGEGEGGDDGECEGGDDDHVESR